MCTGTQTLRAAHFKTKSNTKIFTTTHKNTSFVCLLQDLLRYKAMADGTSDASTDGGKQGAGQATTAAAAAAAAAPTNAVFAASGVQPHGEVAGVPSSSTGSAADAQQPSEAEYTVRRVWT
jgi:hypothetical protein